MIENGSFTKEIYAEYDRLQKGVLSQFEQIRTVKFAGEPFNYLETAEKQTEQNYNMLDGQINNEPKKPSVRRQLDLAKQNPQAKTEHQPKNKSEPEL